MCLSARKALQRNWNTWERRKLDPVRIDARRHGRAGSWTPRKDQRHSGDCHKLPTEAGGVVIDRSRGRMDPKRPVRLQLLLDQFPDALTLGVTEFVQLRDALPYHVDCLCTVTRLAKARVDFGRLVVSNPHVTLPCLRDGAHFSVGLKDRG